MIKINEEKRAVIKMPVMGHGDLDATSGILRHASIRINVRGIISGKFDFFRRTNIKGEYEEIRYRDKGANPQVAGEVEGKIRTVVKENEEWPRYFDCQNFHPGKDVRPSRR